MTFRKASLLFLFLSLAHLAQTQAQFQWVLPLQSKHIPFGSAAADAWAVRENKQIYVVSEKKGGRSLSYDSLSHQYGTIWKTWKHGLQGVWNMDVGEMLPPVYENIIPVSIQNTNWAFEVYKYGMNAIVNTQNNVVLPYQSSRYARLSFIGDSILAFLKHDVYDVSKADLLYVSMNGKTVSDEIAQRQSPPSFKRISSNQYILTTWQKGKPKSDTFAQAEQFIKDIAIARKDSLFGYLRRDGKWAIKPLFQAALPFNEAGHAVVKTKGKYGVIRPNGSFLIEAKYAFLKPSVLGLFEFKESGKLGIIDTTGKIIVPTGNFKGFLPAGTRCLAAQSGDSLIVFRFNGEPMALGNVAVPPSNPIHDQYFLVRQKNGLQGVASPDGAWAIPPALKGGVEARKNFFVARAEVEPCCTIGPFNIGANQPNKYLIFRRNGDVAITAVVDQVQDGIDLPYIVYGLGKKWGVYASPEVQLKPEFDEIKMANNHFFFVRKGKEWGIVKWEN